jgi:hypothetical protein
MPNCSEKLSFRIFSDDTNVFYESNCINDIEITMNEEFNHILQYYSANKLSINEKKTNFMIISSNKKNFRSINISHIVQKDYILKVFRNVH